MPHITLEQWRSLIAVVEAGGYAQAAELLHKSQSAVTYSVQKIESLLGVKAFEIQGRTLRQLPLREGGTREMPLYLIRANPDCAGS